MEIVNILKGITFLLALSGTIYFTCNFIIWLAWKIKPDNFERKITNKDILRYNVIMFLSLVLWTMLYTF